jgi:hypothetical protein
MEIGMASFNESLLEQYSFQREAGHCYNSHEWKCVLLLHKID